MKIQKDKVVSMHYKVELENGEVVDNSFERDEPLSFLVGHNQILGELESEIMDMEPEQKKEVSLNAADAYGEWDEKLLQIVQRTQIPDDIDLKKGQWLTGKQESGETVNVKVHDFNQDEVTLDMNHPLAGESLTFNVEIVDVREPTEEELSHGHAH
ncbi:MAG: peptidylprolyl isomerase [Caldithrix sp.]|nr:peptidylprolyl isomerase [Caldithrix sp.]